jgi:hypothetical protein
MSHYTLLSGKRTDTITSRCPVCLKVTHHPDSEVDLTDITVCCVEHIDKYIPKLWELWHRAQLWGRDNSNQIDSVGIFNDYMTKVGV